VVLPLRDPSEEFHFVRGPSSPSRRLPARMDVKAEAKAEMIQRNADAANAERERLAR
jgi:hypothetical protein